MPKRTIISIKTRESIARIFFMISASTAIIAVGLICLFLFARGIPTIANIGVFDFLFGQQWRPTSLPPATPQFGILPFIVGSLYVTAGAILLGVPIGLFTAVFMAKMCPKPVYKVLKPVVNLLAGIPSVVYGYFGMVIIVPFIRENFGGRGFSMLAACIVLGIMILPTIIGVTEAALRAVPEELYEGAVALGASHERAVFRVIFPAAKSGTLAAIVLGVGRAIGETMAVVMVAGNQTVLRAPNEFLMGIRTLTSNVVIDLQYSQGLHEEALIATGVVLFVFIMIINLSFSLLRRERK